jgi:hypothetical protein
MIHWVHGVAAQLKVDPTQWMQSTFHHLPTTRLRADDAQMRLMTAFVLGLSTEAAGKPGQIADHLHDDITVVIKLVSDGLDIAINGTSMPALGSA